MKTDLELALECAINVYHRYAARRPIDDYLSKNEFSKLLKDTLPQKGFFWGSARADSAPRLSPRSPTRAPTPTSASSSPKPTPTTTAASSSPSS
uniref:S100/CaBP-9k-type calcium binding subdomain domain-containing protein n=1 Tax=Cyanistes caeruleus TaxID=156563 RepID=A0A8C0UDK7_CYACU